MLLGTELEVCVSSNIWTPNTLAYMCLVGRTVTDDHAVDLAQRYIHAVAREIDDISRRLVVDPWDRANWSQMADWLHERLTQFRRIITEYEPGTD